MPPPLIAGLLDPANHPEPRPESVELITTHISWLLRTPELVWKIKRPVRFDFLDYGDRAARRRCCEAELRINRRLAPDTYLGLGAVVCDGGRNRLVLPRQAAEWNDPEPAVVMRRLEDDDNAERLLAGGSFTDAELDELARKLATMHAGAVCEDPHDPAPAIRATLAALEDATGAPPPRALATVATWLREWLRSAGPDLAARRAQGRVCEGHGDLRLEHVYRSEHGLQVIDGIDFDPALRQIDVADEVAFLLADCERCGRRDLGEWFVARYALHAGDYGLYRVLDGLRCHRLLVMAKVATIKAADDSLPAGSRRAQRDRARRCIALAAGITAERRKPRLVVLTGLIASGKSRLAETLARHHGAVAIASDRRRKQLTGLTPTDRGGAELYTPEHDEATYRALLADAEVVLRSGRDVVCDASFRQLAWRRRAVELARRCGAESLIVHPRCRRDALRRRLRARASEGADPSDADETLLDRFAAAYESPAGDEPAPLAIVDTDAPPTDVRERLERVLGACHWSHSGGRA